MEGFKSNTKMQCFKEGGSVKYKSRKSEMAEEKQEEKKDITKDVGMIKKGVKQHEEARHKGEPKTELKLKKGGRMKKEGGCVGRYKKGGAVKKYADGGMASYSEAMDTPQGKKLLSDAKMRSLAKMTPLIKDTPLSEISESNAAKGLRNYGRMYKQGLGMKPDTGYEYKKGGKVKKYADGRSVTGAAMTDAEKARMNLTGAAQTEEEKARMPAGKLPQQVVDEEAMAANTQTREMVAGPIRKLKEGILEKFKSKTKTPMKKGGSTCR